MVAEVCGQFMGPRSQWDQIRGAGNSQRRRVEMPDGALIDRPALGAEATDGQLVERRSRKVDDSAKRIPDLACLWRIEGHAELRSVGQAPPATLGPTFHAFRAQEFEKVFRAVRIGKSSGEA
jgi:hypothetical protein